jgi:hypothetical protein
VKTKTFTFGDLIRSHSGLALLGAVFVLLSVLFYLLRPGTKEAWAFFAVFAGIGLAVGAVFSVLLVENRRDIHTYVRVDGAFYWWLALTTDGALALLAHGYTSSTSADTRARLRHLLWVWPVGAGFPILHLLLSHSIRGMQTSLLWNAFLVLMPLSTADAAALAEHFLEECRGELGLDNAAFAPSLLKVLVERKWPGNIRELKAFVRTVARVAAFEQDSVLTVEHMPVEPEAVDPSGAAVVVAARQAASVSPPPAPAPAAQAQAHGNVQETDRLWNEVEMKDLAALRRHRFRIVNAEQELGYSDKSRTLTNHLRGFCFKALVHHDFDLAKAARAVVGRDDEALLERTKERLISYLALVEKHVDAHTVEILRNNLQLDYRKYVDRAVDRARASGHGAEAPRTNDGDR